MKDYHPYVFDTANRSFVGKFDEMYQAEQQAGFDSWHQDDLRHLTKRICLDLLADYNFSKVLDIGCGKGAFTQNLKRQNNHVIAVDVSETALKVAQARYPDIQFVQADVARADFKVGSVGDAFDLVTCLETLSYVERWPALLEQFAHVGRYALIALFVPDQPIGFVKSIEDLITAFSSHFEGIEDIRLQTRKQIILFGKSKVMASAEVKCNARI